ncbi:hypothetical protein HAZT_HAZT008994 [Hyalella azteca]|uniref:Peptidase S1 domain-containing protein n=1 Tax=Hyalella azteca TaxID=294128 RepID=A0A6A0H2F3_HYAAZ|nr:hypothetical protein HAZT_HAZT008994 [Hyalella azteca]
MWSCAVVAGQQWLDSDFDAEKKRLCSPQMLAAGYDALSRRVNDVFSKAYLEVKPISVDENILEAAKEALIINDLAQNVTLRKLSEDVPLQGQRSEIIQLTSDIEGLEFEPKLRYEKDFVPCRKRAVANGCGTKYETRRFRRIVGGEDAEPGEWPWMVVINLSRPGFNETRLCGGSLISDRYVLTAGHCFHAALQMGSVSLSSFTVKVGVVYWNSSVEPISIKAMHIAPLYDDDTLTDDLALVKLATPVVFNETVQPICLPERYEDFIGQLASVTGWGYTTPDAKDYNDILQQTQVEVLPQRSCASILDRQMDAIERRKGIICAGFEDGRSDACKGDSGGPLMVQTTCNQWLLIGVVSFGESCSVPDRPGLYVDVARYIDWIVANSDLGKRKLSASPAQEKPVLG